MTGFEAGGTIAPARFVKLTTTNGVVLQCGAASATEVAYGISQKQSRRSPYVDTTAAPGNAALITEPIGVYDRDGESCDLELGAAVTAAGIKLMPDSDGKGVTATGVLPYGAIALQTGTTGDWIRVERQIGSGGGTA